MSDADRPDRSPPLDTRRVVVGAAVLGILGFLSGTAVNQGVKRFFTLPESSSERIYTDAEADEKPRPSSKLPSAIPPGSGLRAGRGMSQKAIEEAILRRNIFDSSAVYDPNAGKVAQGGFDCRESKVKLLGTVVGNEPEYSSALIIDGGGGKGARAEGYATGDAIPGEGTIILIDQNRVCTDNGGCICVGQEVKAPPPGEGGSGEGGVTKLGDGKFQVDKSFLDGALANVETLATQVRAVPHKDADGNVDGFRLSAIRKGTLFEKLGVKNGDVIHAVNGSPLTSAESAMNVYKSLSGESHFNFEITRRNQRQTLDYEVR